MFKGFRQGGQREETEQGNHAQNSVFFCSGKSPEGGDKERGIAVLSSKTRITWDAEDVVHQFDHLSIHFGGGGSMTSLAHKEGFTSQMQRKG